MRLNLLLSTVAAIGIAATSMAQAQSARDLNGPSRQQTQAQPAQTGEPIEVEIDQGVLRPFQIAVAPFSGQNGTSIAEVLSGDLRRSGFFEPINPASFIETNLSLANAPNFPQWTQIGAQAVLYGSVFADVISMTLAKKAAGAGVDGLACVSAGAGGHTGHLSPFAFISAVREFFDGYIAVGGGVGDGAGIAGAVAAGADFVYMGTRFLATTESMAQPAYKQMVIDAGPDDLVVSDAVTGTAASWLKPSLRAAGQDPDNLGGPAVRDYASGGDTKRWRDIWAAGQGIESVKAVEPTADVVAQLEREYVAALERFERKTAKRPALRGAA